jgi:RNA polymerase primary sigma factor
MVAFLDKVEEPKSAVRVTLGEAHHQSQVGFGQVFLSEPALGLTRRDRCERARKFFVAETVNKLLRVTRLLVQRLGREPSPEEIAEQMEMSLDKVQKVLKIVKEPISLETPLGDEEESSLGDLIEDQLAPSPVEVAIRSNLGELTRKVLATLAPREEQILRMRFGIGRTTDYTLEEVGKRFAVTRERIRQIEARALRKLRDTGRSRILEGFMEREYPRDS